MAQYNVANTVVCILLEKRILKLSFKIIFYTK